jgi:phospho-N-acetylmuramoyl-pentapeptide-transferase
MEFQVVIPVLISFAISVVLGPVIIPFLRRLKMGQTERTEGVQSHLKKAGTPTMGGVIFLIATAITALFYVGDYPKIIPVLFLTLGFGIIGFLDDYLKVVLFFAGVATSDMVCFQGCRVGNGALTRPAGDGLAGGCTSREG